MKIELKIEIFNEPNFADVANSGHYYAIFIRYYSLRRKSRTRIQETRKTSQHDIVR